MKKKTTLLIALAVLVAGAAFAGSHQDHPDHECTCGTETGCQSGDEECSCGSGSECQCEDHSCTHDCGRPAPVEEEPATGGCRGCHGGCGN